jgi:hypothetical protein
MMVEVPVPGPTEHPFRSAFLICGVIILLIALGVLLKLQGSSAAAGGEHPRVAALRLRGTVSP